MPRTATHKPLGLTASEAARELGVTPRHIYNCCAKGLIRHVRLGDRIVIPRAAIEELLHAPSAADR